MKRQAVAVFCTIALLTRCSLVGVDEATQTPAAADAAVAGQAASIDCPFDDHPMTT